MTETNYQTKRPDTVVGKCPDCGGDIIAKDKAYFCSNGHVSYDKETGTPTFSGCQFKIWKNQHEHIVTEEEATTVLNGGILPDIDVFLFNIKEHRIVDLKLMETKEERETGKLKILFHNDFKKED